jgi:anti-sigma B factor antagonist
MDFRITSEVNSARLTVTGEIDERGAEEFKGRLQGLLGSHMKEVVIDFDGVTYIGSSGIGKLLLFYKNLAVHGGQVQVVNVQPDIHQLFRELKLDSIFTIRGK